MKDPIVQEVRQHRDRHSKRFDYNLDAICEDYKASQTKFGDRLVRLGPTMFKKKSGTKTARSPRSAKTIR